MSQRAVKDFPYKVLEELPKGHAFGLKSRNSFRTTFERTLDKAIAERNTIMCTGAISAIIIDRKTKSPLK